jgi:4-azaleucine resistance transporter AzlC
MVKVFFSGIVAALPIATGYFPVAITFGILVVNTGLGFLDAILASALVFAGAAQFMAIGMYAGIAAGAGTAAGLQIVVAGWLLNLRHLLMSSVIAHNLGGTRTAGNSVKENALRSVLAFGVTDEVFGVASLRIAEGGQVRPPFLLGLELGAYAAWVGGTAVGATMGEILPPGLRAAMGLALYALFAALLAGQVRAGRTVPVTIAAIVAAAVNVILRSGFGVGPGGAFPPAMIAGALAGWVAASSRGDSR